MKKMLAGMTIWIVLGAAACAQVSLSSAVDLALRDSSKVRMAEAEQIRARGVLTETHAAYIPNLYVGAGLGYSMGFPLGTPNLFNANSQSLVFSFSQPDYIRSARAALRAAIFSLQDARQQVILDTATAYLELDKTNRQIAALNEAINDADQLIAIVGNRVAAGMDSRVEETRARLTRAQMHLQKIQLGDRAEELRQHISNLTGLPANSLTLDASSIPAFPDLDISTPSQPTQQNPAVQAALATADARQYTAHGDDRQNYLPTFEQIAQYSLFSTFNNYQNYYTSFQQNNFGFEVQVVWPLFDPVHRAKGIESDADAIIARHQALQTKIQVSEKNLALWHQLRELKAKQEVATLKQELAKDTLDSLLTQMQNGTGSSTAPAVTPRQAEQSRIDERTGYIDMLDADFEVERVQLGLLRLTGGLEDWVKSQK